MEERPEYGQHILSECQRREGLGEKFTKRKNFPTFCC